MPQESPVPDPALDAEGRGLLFLLNCYDLWSATPRRAAYPEMAGCAGAER